MLLCVYIYVYISAFKLLNNWEVTGISQLIWHFVYIKIEHKYINMIISVVNPYLRAGLLET